MKEGRIFSINLSTKKGVTKESVNEVRLIENFGLEGDAHGGQGLRQVSLLAIESIERQRRCPKTKKKNISLGPGDFAENITTKGLNLRQLKIGDIIVINGKVILEVAKIGKECHRYCAIYKKIGDCIMPREGIFARVIKAGLIRKNDTISIREDVNNLL